MSVANGRLGELLDPRRLTRNVVYSLAGWVLPAVAALVAFPVAAQRLGSDRFAILALSWGLAGWFSQFDFGIGRALTKEVAARHSTGRDSEIPRLVWSATFALGALALVVALVLWVAAPALVTRVLDVPPILHVEAIAAARWLAVAVVPITLGPVHRAVLEARQQFRLATYLRIPLGVGSFLLPLLAADAASAVGWVVAARTVYWVAMIVAARVPLVRPDATGALFRDGAWISLSAVISPLLVQGDRFALAALVPIAASGSYASAQEVATKLAFFSIALQPVLFAAASAASGVDDRRARQLERQAAFVTIAVLAVPTLVLAIWAAPLLKWWMGSAFDLQAGRVLPWMAGAVFVNAVAQVPYAFLQAGRGARAVGLLHLVELPVYAWALVVAVPRWGMMGAALVWAGRMLADAVAMWWLSVRRA